MVELILASGSPRRKELLEQVSIPFQVCVTNVDESEIDESDPKKLVELLAKIKGDDVTPKQNQVVLSADTVVSFGGKVLTKPKNAVDALMMLKSLNGNKHQVFTGVRIQSTENDVLFTVCTHVEFWNLPESILQAYIDTGDSFDKAGGYGIQTAGAVLVKQIEGDYYNVVGLPISRVVKCLADFGVYPSFFGETK